jgi:hypothetical protein
MNDAAYLRIEALIAELESSIGVRGLGEETITARAWGRWRSPFEDGERSRGETREFFEPVEVRGRQRVLDRLDALERHVTLLDHNVFLRARDTINRVLDRSTPRGDRGAGGRLDYVTVQGVRAGEHGFEKFNFEDLPDMSGPLAAIRALRGRILEDDNDAG